MTGAGYRRREVLTAAGLFAAGVAVQRSQAAGGDADPVDVEAFGASVTATPARNLAAFRAAIKATPTGGTLRICARGGHAYVIDTSGGFGTALKIDRQMTVVLDGKLRATHGMVQLDPPYLFAVTASDVAFVGEGELAGPGAADDRNEPDDRNFPGLIHVTGSRFRFIGPTVRDVPKIGIHLWQAREATITARWEGGVGAYVTGHTGLFGIRATGGGGHRIVGNHFVPDAQGRRLVTGYFAGGVLGATIGDEIADNVATVHEKLAYLYTSGSVVRDCTVTDAVQTDIVRIVGNDNLVERVTGRRVKGGVSIYNGHNNVVRACTFTDVDQSGIFASLTPGYVDGLAGTKIVDNVIVASDSSTGLQDGICIYLGAGDTRRIAVTGNHVGAAGKSTWRNCIRIEAVTPFFANGTVVRDNVLSGGTNGLSVRRLRGGDVNTNRTGLLRGGAALLEIPD